VNEQRHHGRTAWQGTFIVTGRLGLLLARALDWCADGGALVEVDCTVSHANRAFVSIARARDGIVTRKGAVEIADLQMQARLAAALGAMLRAHDPAAGGSEPIDFQLPRPSGTRLYRLDPAIAWRDAARRQAAGRRHVRARPGGARRRRRTHAAPYGPSFDFQDLEPTRPMRVDPAWRK
jgi:hypothetical protein